MDNNYAEEERNMTYFSKSQIQNYNIICAFCRTGYGIKT